MKEDSARGGFPVLNNT